MALCRFLEKEKPERFHVRVLEGVDTLDAVPNADALPGQAEKSPNVNCVQAQSDVKRR